MLEGVRGCGVGKMLVFTITMSMCHVCSTISFAHAKARDCWSKVTALEWSWLARVGRSWLVSNDGGTPESRGAAKTRARLRCFSQGGALTPSEAPQKGDLAYVEIARCHSDPFLPRQPSLKQYDFPCLTCPTGRAEETVGHRGQID